MNLEEAKQIIGEAIKNDATTLDLHSSAMNPSQFSDADLRILLPDILKLRSLTSIDLSWNNLKDVSFLKDLKFLTSITLWGNKKITNVSFLKDLKSLTRLDLNNSRITDISFLKELNSLTFLNLGWNQISDGSFLKELKSLTYLDLSRTQISDFSFLKELKSLTLLYLGENNPYLDLPKNLKDKAGLDRNDIDEIVRYYEQLESEGEDHIYEAKVLIVGEPNAGKTTLFRKLLDSAYLPKDATKEQKQQTVGVNIDFLEFPFNDEREFKAHLWDFGGHEKQYVLHQYFFTERSLYVLLAHDRNEDANFNYWFEIIATLGANCPVLVVLNEMEAKVPNIDISLYRKEFAEKIKDIEEIRVDFNYNGDGRFASLERQIKSKLRQLDHIGKPLPKTWVKIRERLYEIEEPLISIDDYETICKESGVEKPEYREQIREYLHDLGIALNYKNDPNLRNKLILKPNWVIDALYSVLRNEKIINRAGKFSAGEVFDLWKDYKADEKTILLQLMQKGKFEVAYKLAGKDAYIAPILLPEIAPGFDFDETDGLQIQFEYTFKPKGIISRLIVRFHEDIVVNEKTGEQIVWKKGVLLKNKDSFARVIESEQFRKLTIAVSGGSAYENRKFITEISNEIKRIHRDWFDNRLIFEEKVRCNCDECGKSDSPYFFKLSSLERKIGKGIGHAICDKSDVEVDILLLLTGVYIVKTEEVDEGLASRILMQFDSLNISNIRGRGNKVFQGLKDARIIIQEKIVDEVSREMNDAQRQMMEKFADEIISRIETKALSIRGEEELEDAKKGKWEAKLKFSLLFISLEFSRKITPDEFVSKVQQYLYGDDLQTNILED